MPKWAWRWITSATYRRTTKILHTAGGAQEVGPGYEEVLDPREVALITGAQMLWSDERDARMVVARPAGYSGLRTTAQLWTKLRELIFGVLDASADLREFGFEKLDGKVPVFGRVSEVLPAEVSATESSQQRIEGTSRLEPITATPSVPGLEQQAEFGSADPNYPTDQQLSGDAGALSRRQLRLMADQGMPDAVGYDALTEDQLTAVGLPEPVRDSGIDAVEENPVAPALKNEYSFSNQLFSRMRRERERANAHLQMLTNQLENFSVPQPGELIRLRRRFHRTILLTSLIGLPILGLLIWVLARYYQGAWRLPADIDELVRNLLWASLVVAVVLIFIAIPLLALTAYHAGWSVFQRNIDVHAFQIAQLRDNGSKVRQEIARLDSLHDQTEQWIALLSRAIQHPWSIPQRWLNPDEYSQDDNLMPFAMRQATVRKDDHGANSRLRSSMVDALLVRGWRYEAFEMLLRAFAVERGIAPSSFDTVTLDNDLPHASNNSRSMLMAAMSDQKLLTRVARYKLDGLLEVADREHVEGRRPRVIPTTRSQLHQLSRAFGLDTPTEDQDWDDFLLAPAVGGKDSVTPLSAGVLIDTEIGDRYHERVQTYFVAPQRLTVLPEVVADDSFHVIAVHDRGAAAVELSWRVDIAGPVPVHAISLWESVESSEQDQNRQKSQLPDSGLGGEQADISGI